MTASIPDGDGSSFSAPSNTTIRCDDLLHSQQSAGCVVKDFVPTIDRMSGLPRIAAHIAHIQNSSPDHYGQHRGSGPQHPLNRLTNKSARNANRRAVCPRKAPPKHKGESCDEYPFASTYQGGKALPDTDRGIAWVPPAEQHSQGGLLNAFYLENRILDKDAYWVKV